MATIEQRKALAREYEFQTHKKTWDNPLEYTEWLEKQIIDAKINEASVDVPPVSGSFYAVVHTYAKMDAMQVLILGRTRELAIFAFEKYNGMQRGKLTRTRMHAYQLVVRRVAA